MKFNGGCMSMQDAEQPRNRVRILLADDHNILAEGLRSLLAREYDVVGIVQDGRE